MKNGEDTRESSELSVLHPGEWRPLKRDPTVQNCSTAVSSEAWAKLCDWASVVGRGRLLLSGSVAHASLKNAVLYFLLFPSMIASVGTCKNCR